MLELLEFAKNYSVVFFSSMTLITTIFIQLSNRKQQRKADQIKYFKDAIDILNREEELVNKIEPEDPQKNDTDDQTEEKIQRFVNDVFVASTSSFIKVSYLINEQMYEKLLEEYSANTEYYETNIARVCGTPLNTLEKHKKLKELNLKFVDNYRYAIKDEKEGYAAALRKYIGIPKSKKKDK